MHYTQELIFRILAGTFLGGIIGYERELHHRPAGLRTHLLVAISAATFMTISTHLTYYQEYRPGDLVMEDPSRVAAAIVTGIGFLGGGAILRTGATVQGLTTAASLWLVTAIGMTAGSGMFLESAAVTVLGMAVLTFLRRFERDSELLRQRIVLTFQGTVPPDLPRIKEEMAELEARVIRTELDRHLDSTRTKVTLVVSVAAHRETDLIKYLERLPGVLRMRVQALV